MNIKVFFFFWLFSAFQEDEAEEENRKSPIAMLKTNQS